MCLCGITITGCRKFRTKSLRTRDTLKKCRKKVELWDFLSSRISRRKMIKRRWFSTNKIIDLGRYVRINYS
jgi:hypothetical protein